MCIAGNIGAEADISKAPSICKRFDQLAFSESHGRYILGTNEPEKLIMEAKKRGISAAAVGKAGGTKLAAGQYAWSVSDLFDAWEWQMWKVMGGKS
jgi:phosphoribosylformylglycinamidine (FGAM) synthase-like enzyme